MAHAIILDNQYGTRCFICQIVTGSQHPMIVISIPPPPAEAEPLVELHRYRALRVDLGLISLHIIKKGCRKPLALLIREGGTEISPEPPGKTARTHPP
ncbi:hypothetical protein D3C81_2023410 [compost metagenome]